jgi:hypothetical protein
MKTSDCFNAAKNDLDNARRYLESGQAVNWVADKLCSALLWAMEGWLIAKGHQISHGRGWADTREAFLKNGPFGLRSQLIPLYAKARHLEFELMGDIDTRPTLPMAEWQVKAYVCLETTEKAVHQLLADIELNSALGANHKR